MHISLKIIRTLFLLFTFIINKNVDAEVRTTFYGCDVNVPTEFPSFKWNNAKDAEGISSILESIDLVLLDNYLVELKSIRKRLKLDDWGFLELIKKVIKIELQYETDFVITVVTFRFLYEMNYGVKLFYNACRVNIYGKMDFDSLLLNKYNFSFKGVIYQDVFGYRGLFTCNERAFMYDNLPEKKERSIKIGLNSPQVICRNIIEKEMRVTTSDSVYKIKLFLDSSLMNYFDHIPDMYPNVLHLKNGLSDDAKKALYPPFKHILKNKNLKESLDFLLLFCQENIIPLADSLTERGDRTIVPEETLFLGYGDCQDKSLLFAKLVNDLLKLKTVAFIYPEHVNIGILLPANMEGVKFEYKGKKYTVADPAFGGYTLGMTAYGQPMRIIPLF